MTTEDEAVRQRRAAAGVDPDEPACGLALSGGGVRSATFCLGLLRALAANRVLRRFDYLSTVSGGGYAGAALGRLFRAGTPVGDIEAGLASDGSLFLWWLRANGRYLIPAGMRDMLQAAAYHLRGFFATQFEAAVLALAVAAVIVLPHVLIHAFGLPLDARAWLQGGGTLWWAALPLAALAAGIAIVAFWFAKDDAEGARWPDLLLAAGLFAAAGWLFVRMLSMDGQGGAAVQLAVLGLVAIGLLCVPLGYIVRLVRARFVSAAEDRIVYTGWLAASLGAFGIILAFGLADLASWLAAWLWLREDDLRLSGGAGFAVLVLIAARAVLPVLEKLQRGSAGGLPLERVTHFAGLALIVLLVLLWLALLQAFVFLAEDGPALRAVLAENADSSLARWSAVLALLALYAAFTWRNLPQLNRSSLHEFYRSRLARTYVAVGNYPAGRARDPSERFPSSPLTENSRALTEQTEKVTRLLSGDDVLLRDYRPHAAGGPIHLVNCCINQTRDDRTGNFNADRKGIALAVSALGLETGTQPAAPLVALAETPLSLWVAISGAAMSSGMGSFTRPGTSALLFLSGLRLGYWWRHRASGVFGKYRAAISEMLARFPGLRSPAWYLSDGGHFDNTGVYALLKRRLPVIVLADCGADPSYLFADLESLVRKARLDYAAHIEFVDPKGIPDPALASLMGTPDTIGPEPGDSYLLLARIRYAGGATGALLVVKPRRLSTLPLDITGYADRDPYFPQQTTGDQFFDEAQWESYHALGRLLGNIITPKLIGDLPAWVAHAAVTDIGSVTPAAKVVPVAPPTRRERVVATVGTSLGVGAVASVLLAGWQLWDEHNRLEAERQRAFLEAAGKMADAVATAKAGFTPEIKLRLDALVSLASSPADDLAGRRQTLATVADSLEPLCAVAAEREANQCRTYVRALRGEQFDDGPVRQALAQYWVDQSARPTALVATSASVSMPAKPAAPAAVRAEKKAEKAPAAAPEQPPERSAIVLQQSAEPPAQAAPPPPVQAQQAASAAAWTRAACSTGTKSGMTLYLHIYDENQREVAKRVARRALEAGVAVPGIENVVATAQRDYGSPPARWEKATWLYRGEDGRRCAEAASAWLASEPGLERPSQVIALPAALRAPPGVIELWLPAPPAP